MRRKIVKSNALDFINRIATEIEDAKPTKQTMIADLKMMNFKVRPITGDLFSIPAKADTSFIKTLWKMGKIEGIVQTALRELTDPEIEILFDYLDQLDSDFDTIKPHIKKIVQLEIFRDSEFDEVLLN